MATFARFHDFDREIHDASVAFRVPVALIKAIIAAESAFNPRAYRYEAHINDASYGLMQILSKTARSVGFTGTTEQLYDPAVNVRYGTTFFADLLRTAAANGYGPDSAISAYNAGFSGVRRGDGKRTTNEPGAPFINQAYVDRVQRYYRDFSGSPTASVAAQPLAPVVVTASRDKAPERAEIPPLVIIGGAAVLGLLLTLRA